MKALSLEDFLPMIKDLIGIFFLATLFLMHVQPASADSGQPIQNFTFGGTVPWFNQSAVLHDGIDAYQSGAISHSQSSWMETTVTGPGVIRFWWKVSSESCCDPLTFAIDGNFQADIRGVVDWQSKGFVVPAGSHIVRWTYSTDSSVLSGSNAGWVDQITFEQGSNIDITPPVTTATPADGMYGASQSVALACSDGTGSSCTGTYYCLGSSCTPTSPYSGTITISSSIDLKYYSTDAAGNSEQVKTATYTFDTSPPTTSVYPAAGSYSGARNVTLSCDDSGLGCAATYYCLGAGCTPSTIYSTPIALNASTDLRYFSTDKAGNIEAVKTAGFTITPDTTPPTTTTNAPSGTYGPFYLYFMCSDGNGSGCANTYYCLEAGCTPTTAYVSSLYITASTDVSFYSQDKSVNSEPIKTVSYVLDKTPPVTTANPPGGSYEAAPLVTLACSDSNGTGCWTTYYCLEENCTPSTLYRTPIPINSSTTLRYYSIDNAANSEAVVTAVYVNPSQPKTITVSGMSSTIQAAIDGAYNGDTVLVSSGTYLENINFKGKGITVQSVEGADSTIIDGNGTGSVVTFSSGESLSAVLDGFTIRNGKSDYEGGGIYIYNSSPTIRNNKITANSAFRGAGVYVGFGSPLIRNNNISLNVHSSYGGGILIGGATASGQIINNTISDNRSSSGGGVCLWAAGTTTIKGNTIKNNSSTDEGGGISVVNPSNAIFVQNLIANNKAQTGGGVYANSSDYFINNTIVNNDATQGSGVYNITASFINNVIIGKSGQSSVYCFSNPSNFRHNIVFSPSGSAYTGTCTDQNGLNGNITADPLLSNPASGYYGLLPGSPAIDAGDNAAQSLPSTDFEGMTRIIDGNNDGTAVVDMGAYEFDPTRPIAELRGVPTEFLTVNWLNLTVGGTGVVSYRYALDGAAFASTDIPVATPISLTGLANGQHSIVVLGKNALGREQLLSSATAATWVVNTETTNLSFNYGGAAPWFVQTAVTHDGIAYQSSPISSNQSTWMETAVTGPGAIRFWWKVSSQEYFNPLNFSIDGVSQTGISGETDWQFKVFAVPSGSHTLRWTYSVGGFTWPGLNAGWVDQIDFKAGSNLDIVSPATTATPPGGIYSSSQGVTLSCNDGTGSGCANIYYCLGSGCTPTTIYGGGTIAIATPTDLRYYATDVAGNSDVIKTATYTFDHVPPTSATSPAAGTYSGARDVSLNCSDSGMGCANTFYCLGASCTPTTPYVTPIAITTTTDLRFYSTDRGNNSEAVKTATFTITPDVTPPTTTPNYPSGAYLPMSVSLSCNDGVGGGCAATYYCLGSDCSPTTSVSGTIRISISTDLRFCSIDRSGNSEVINTVSYLIDTDKPTTIPGPGGGIYATPQEVTLTCSDGTGSGCSRTYYCLSNEWCAPNTRYGGPIYISSTAYLHFYSIDNVGNEEFLKSVRYNIATGTPITINVPADYTTIQTAIYASHDGDTILVAPGTYIENINFKGKAITVQSSGGPDITTIDGNQQGSVVVFSSHEWNTSTLSGFTIRNGGPPASSYGILNGGGVYINNASPTLTNNKIIQNHGCDGSGIYASGYPIIRNNIISDNSRTGCSGGFGGGGIFLWGGLAQIVENTITNNTMTYANGGGIHLRGSGEDLISGNIISNNGGLGVHGGGIYVDNATDARIVQNLITGNQASYGGGVYFSRGAILVNNTIADNDAYDGSGVYIDRYSYSSGQITNNIIVGRPDRSAIHSESDNTRNPPLRNNLFFSPSGTIFAGTYPDQNGINGNITAPPAFTAPGLGYYALTPGSPAIDAGDNAAPSLPATDLLGLTRVIDGNNDGTATVDIGAYEYDPTAPRATINGVPSGFTTATYATLAVGGEQIVSYRYSIDGGPFTANENPVGTPVVLSGLADGLHMVAVIGKDATSREQRISYATVASWHVDTIAPATSSTPPGGILSSPNVTLSCSDGIGSGCATTYYCLGKGCTPSTLYSTPIAISALTDLRFYSMDLAGNREEIKTLPLSILPPVTTATPEMGTYRDAQNVALTCSSVLSSGCTGTYYCLGSGCTPSTRYAGPIAISSSTMLRFYSTDVGGNSEQVKSYSYTIDPSLAYRFERLWPQLPQPWYFGQPSGVAVDVTGNIYVADSGNHRIQKFDSKGNYLSQWGAYGSGSGQFYYPWGVAVDASGNVYVSDSSNYRIQKFDGNGNYLTKWGIYGSGNGQFVRPEGLAVDTTGNVYVADTGNNRIQKFDSNGNYLTQWSAAGNGDGQFSQPEGVAVDPAGNVYVADTGNNRIQKFNSSGTYLSQWGSLGGSSGQFSKPSGVAVNANGDIFVADSYNWRIQKFDGNGNYLSQWGSYGSGDGQFIFTNGVAVSSNGNVYVADINNGRIQIFDSSGNYLSQWGSEGSNTGQLRQPYDAAVDTSGNVYVADTMNHSIQKFDSNGNHLARWGTLGSGNGQFYSPQGVAVDGAGNVYVADTFNHRIQKFTSSGTFLTQWVSIGSGSGLSSQPSAIAVDTSGNIYVSDMSNHIRKFDNNGNFLTEWGSTGNGNGQFNVPLGIAVDLGGNVFVSDFTNNRIQKFDSNGNYLAQWGTFGVFNGPQGVAVDGNGNNYVTDWNNHIQKFDKNGNFLTAWGSAGSSNGQFHGPRGVAIDGNDNVYVADTDNNRIQKFSLAVSLPGAPTGVTANAGNGGITVSFTTPDSDGGSPILFYTVTSSPGNITAKGTSSPVRITGLNSGTTYTFTVTASNAAGAGAASAASNGITAAPGIAVSPAFTDFGPVPINRATAQQFTINNTGTAILNVSSPLSITGLDSTSFTVSLGGQHPCASLTPTIPEGGSCTVWVTFTTSLGTKTASLHIVSNALNSPVLDIPLTGTGIVQYSLTTHITGSGTVNNITQPPAFSCDAPTCTAPFAAGTTLTLRATPASLNTFAGWSGDGCSGTDDCPITLNSDTTVTATFAPLPLVQIVGIPTEFQSLEAAYAATPAGCSLKARNVTFAEDFHLDRPVSVTLWGGLGGDFTTVNDYTFLRGVLTLELGSLTVNNLVIY